jgi:hypothetical protein
VDIILIHGMGRTPLSMLVLRHRLQAAGFSPSLFGYSPTFESFGHCAGRLLAHIRQTPGGRPYALVGHSLGAVLIRAVLPQLEENPPAACFFLAPPSQASRAAQYFAGNPLYKLLMGEMGQLLASEDFMDSLPAPAMPTRIYAGICDFAGRFSAFGDEPNDGILTLKETEGALAIPAIPVPSTHTFIMNSRQVADDIAGTLGRLRAA